MLDPKETTYSEKEKKAIRDKYYELCGLISKRSPFYASDDGEIIIGLPGGGEYRDPPGICSETKTK